MATINEVMRTDFAHLGDFLAAPTGDFDTQTGLANLQTALMHRLITSPGSFVFRPDYGVGIKRWQNAPATMANDQAIAARIEEQFLLDPRVDEVNGVRVERDDYASSITKIYVTVQPVGYDDQTLTFVPFGDTVNA